MIASIYLIIAIKAVVIKSIITHHFGFYNICFIIKVIHFDELNIFYGALQTVMAFAKAITEPISNNQFN